MSIVAPDRASVVPRLLVQRRPRGAPAVFRRPQDGARQLVARTASAGRRPHRLCCPHSMQRQERWALPTVANRVVVRLVNP